MITKLIFFAMTLVTWYLAAMTHSWALTVAFVVELILVLVMKIQSILLRRSVSVGFPISIGVGEKERDCLCHVNLSQNSFLPLARVQLTFFLRYNGQKSIIRRFAAGVPSHAEEGFEFYVQPPYCGSLTIDLKAIRVYDFLSLFPSERRLRETMILAVFPPERFLYIQSVALTGAQNAVAASIRLSMRGEQSPEIRDIREYYIGDSAKAIHWKQSARTDRLWTREFERETQTRFHLALEAVENVHLHAATWDSFYEVLSALILGLMVCGGCVQVYWKGGEKQMKMRVRSADDCRAILWQLYQFKLGKAPDLQDFPEDGFHLDTSLCWRRGKNVIHHFSSTNFIQEIEQRRFLI